MKYTFLLIMVSIVGSNNVWASAELDSEINDLQVRIVRVQPKPKAKPVTPKVYAYEAAPPKIQSTRKTQPVIAAVAAAQYPVTVSAVAQAQTQQTPRTQVRPVVAQATLPSGAFQPTEDYTDQNRPQSNVTSKVPEQINYETKFLRRFEIVPAFAISSFDGSDSSLLIPAGISSPAQNSFLNASVRTDVDLGFAPLYLETGIMVNQYGSTTGVPSSNILNGANGTAFTEKINLTYVSIPLNVKWRLAPEEASAIYLKAGIIPAFMVSHTYQSTTPVSDEFRLGAYNTFDIMVDGGLGYDFKITKSIHALAEVTVFQGLMPVTTNYSVYNYGLLTGIGVAFLL